MSGSNHIGAAFPAVLDAAQQGQSQAIGELWRAYSPVVAGYARVEGVADPDDVASEVFLGALRALPRFRGDEGQFRSWLFTIAYRRIVDERRRFQRRPEPVEAPVEISTGHSAEDVVVAQARVERVVELCQRLVPAQRQVLMLRLVAGLTVEEVAQLTERSPGAVKALQRRGLAGLSRILQREGVPL